MSPNQNVGRPLAEYAHLVAIDLPGFGHSQRCDVLAAPKAMGEFIIRACDAFSLEHAHVIGPDIGTAPALFAAAKYPDRLRSLAVGGGAAAVPLQLGGLPKDWVETPDLSGRNWPARTCYTASGCAARTAAPTHASSSAWPTRC